jgi:hypothetical protein
MMVRTIFWGRKFGQWPQFVLMYLGLPVVFGLPRVVVFLMYEPKSGGF